ncbi:transcriptional regulator TrmB [Micromonospora sp. DR5-3]|uniref:helix-turn-helix domain-containing protein n=1 Tax=unclassified Micromonospora TaxID=2617518 RepID=UPI0011D9F55D|nr:MULTISPECIES: helix-turn-helix domain-containing protein [unclassified Micromonospora]MCW3816360.1 transcriptional regulator TrmB [Micromonospora sp. DR5-3]TYC22763.1 transcriptional regulator TrmB [Micromonospora sp. MP36]
MLGALGLTSDEESVYRQLVGRASASSVDLADATRLTEAAVEAALSQLMADGLVKRTPDGEFSAAPPAVALGALISERRDGLHTAELALVTLAEEHRVAMAGRSISELIEVVTGVDGIRHRFAQVQHAARAQVRNFVTAPFVAVPPGTNNLETVMMDRGVEYRVVLERAALAEPGMITETVTSLRKGVQVRVAESLPIKLVLADEELGLVPLTVESGGEPGAVLLHRSGLLSAMDALFEIVWRHAHPLDVSALGGLTDGDVTSVDPNGPTELDRKILALLLAGLTDQVVASQLDVSLRTLQRRLRHLMDLAGVKTRMELGWYAARHDWA